MTRARSQTAIVVAILVSVSSSALGSSFTFSLLPEDGFVEGAPGSTVGWGYSFSNLSSTEWLVPTGLNADSFLFGMPLAIFDFPILAPATSASVPFDALAGSGLYQLTWDLSAPNHYTNFGRFTLTDEWWNGDPFNGGSFSHATPDSSQAYFATVAEATAAPAEPQSFILLGTALLGIYIRRRCMHAPCVSALKRDQPGCRIAFPNLQKPRRLTVQTHRL